MNPSRRPGPSGEQRPSDQVLMVPVLLARGVPAAQVAHLTEVPVALVELIAQENHPTPPDYWAFSGDQQAASRLQKSSSADAAAPAAAFPAATFPAVSAGGAVRVRWAPLLLQAISVVSATAAVVSVLARQPELGKLALAGGMAVLISVSVMGRRRTRRTRPPRHH